MISLQQQINDDIKDAMKARNADRLAALRAVKSAIMLEATKEGTTTVPDKVSLKLITKLVKQRKDSAAIFIKQNRQVNRTVKINPKILFNNDTFQQFVDECCEKINIPTIKIPRNKLTEHFELNRKKIGFDKILK